MRVPLYELTDTWDDAATDFVGFSLDVTDTNSDADSRLIDMKVGGTSKLIVYKDGRIASGDATLGVGVNWQFQIADTGGIDYRIRNTGAGGGSDTNFRIMVADNDATPSIFFGTATGNNQGAIQYLAGADQMLLRVANATTFRVTATDLRPETDNAIDLGTASFRYDDVYATNGTIITSDANEKQDIQDIPDALAIDFIKALTPRLFRRKDGTRLHAGLIAQELKAALDATGHPSDDFAGYIDAPVIDEEGNEAGRRLGLRTDQLIAPLIKAVQQIEARLAAIEAP